MPAVATAGTGRLTLEAAAGGPSNDVSSGFRNDDPTLLATDSRVSRNAALCE